MKRIIGVVAALYLAFGIYIAVMMQKAIPAISPAGQVYLAVAWPLFTKASPIHPPIPAWCFQFEDRGQ